MHCANCWLLHLSPLGRGRPRSGRVRGSHRHDRRNVRSSISSTPPILSYTSVLVTRTIKKPNDARMRVRSSSRRSAAGVECVTPSISITSLPSNVTKSTTNRSIGCCLRNFQSAILRFRNACQRRNSALVCAERSFRALALNCSIPLTRPLRGRPLPRAERCSRICDDK